MEQYFLNYGGLDQQRWMVSDRTRTDAFAKAIFEVVRPGDTVIDVGAGTGILSILAAKAGAKKVIAVERSDMAHFAKELISRNGFSDVIEVFHGNAENLEIDGEADVIVSEWLGHLGYVEDMLKYVLNVRDKFLRPGGIMLPAAVDIVLAPVDDSKTYSEDGAGFWQNKNIFDIDFSFLTDKELSNGHTCKKQVADKFLLAKGKVIGSLEITDAKKNDEWSKGSVKFQIERDGVINAVAGWFKTRLSDNVILDTAPDAPVTHWEQTVFPFYETPVKKGQIITIDYKMDDPYEGSRMVEMILKIEGKEIKYIVD